MYFGNYYENWKQVFHGNHDNVQGCFDMKLYVTKNAIKMTFWSQNGGLGFSASIMFVAWSWHLWYSITYTVYIHNNKSPIYQAVCSGLSHKCQTIDWLGVYTVITIVYLIKVYICPHIFISGNLC